MQLFNRINFVLDRLDAEHYCLDLQADHMFPSIYYSTRYFTLVDWIKMSFIGFTSVALFSHIHDAAFFKT